MKDLDDEVIKLLGEPPATQEGFARELLQEFRRHHPEIAVEWERMTTPEEMIRELRAEADRAMNRLDAELLGRRSETTDTFVYTTSRPADSYFSGIYDPDLTDLPRLGWPSPFRTFAQEEDPYDRATRESKALRAPKQLPPYLRVIK
jgi:DNA-binding transcriptional LysR family regulator